MLTKVIYPKYSKHWLYTVAHTIGCVWSKMRNHGSKHVLFLTLFKLVQVKIINVGYTWPFMRFYVFLLLPQLQQFVPSWVLLIQKILSTCTKRHIQHITNVCQHKQNLSGIEPAKEQHIVQLQLATRTGQSNAQVLTLGFNSSHAVFFIQSDPP